MAEEEAAALAAGNRFQTLSLAALSLSLHAYHLFAVFGAAVAFSGFVSAGSLLASGLIPLWLWLLGASKVTIMAAAVVALLIWIKHHENIRRLLQGDEKSWKKQ